MKLKTLILSLVLTATSVAVASELYEEFQRRDSIRFNRDEANAINFLRTLQYAVEGIEEIEALDQNGAFVFRDRNGSVCLGDRVKQILRCKNVIGLTTVTYQGDSD